MVYVVWGGMVGTGVSCILTVSVQGDVDWYQFPELSVTSVVLKGCLSPVMGPVIDCVEVGLGG